MGYSPSQRHDIGLLALFRGGSYLGDAVALVTLYLRLAPGGHAWQIATLSIAASLPLVAFAPLAGYAVDRLPAKSLLTLLGLCEAAVCLGVGYWHGVASTILLMLALSSFVAFSMPGYSALVPYIAGEENVARSQGLMQSVAGVAAVAGPALGGLLVGSVGQSWPLYVDAMSFAVCALGTTLLHHDRLPSPGSAIERARSEQMTAGLTLLLTDRLLRPLVVTIAIFILSLGMVNVSEVFFVTRTLHASATLYGLIGASFGLGLIIGSLLAGRSSQGVVSLARTVLLAVLAIGVAIGAVGLVTHVYYIYPLMALAGVAEGIANVCAMTLFTLRTPERLRGRMFAGVNAIFTGGQLGATAAGGLVLLVFAPRTVFQIGGGLSSISVLILGPLALRASRAAHDREGGSH